MFSDFGPAFVGLICVILGIQNMRGNINTIHWYHRHRISPENVAPFGKLAGIGTIICGASMIVFNVFLFLEKLTGFEMLQIVGAVISVIGILAGLAISLYAIIKYNGSLF